MNSKLGFITRRSLFFQGFAIIIIVIEIVIYFQGIHSEWYQTLRKPGGKLSTMFRLPPLVNIIIWIGVYVISIIGMIQYRRRSLAILKTQFFISLLAVSVMFSFAWLWMFFVSRDIHIAVVMQSLTILYMCFFIYILYQYSPILALYQIPLFCWMLYLFVVSYFYSLENPTFDGVFGTWLESRDAEE